MCTLRAHSISATAVCVLYLNPAVHYVVMQSSNVPCKLFLANRGALLLSFVVCLVAVLFIHCIIHILVVLCFPSVKINV